MLFPRLGGYMLKTPSYNLFHIIYYNLFHVIFTPIFRFLWQLY